MSEDSNLKRSRASGEVLDCLLREFEVNQNLNPDQRKEISDRTGMTEKAVRIWFQNRRAKLRKFERMGKPVKQAPGAGVLPRGMGSIGSSRSNLLTSLSATALDQQSATPNELNDKYCFIDCSSLSVGSWQRIKSGQHDHQALKTSLVNLSPFTLDQLMNPVDLMLILSKKNNEINYFFAAIFNNAKILFRIFYPVSLVVSSSLLKNNVNKEHSELRLKLSHTPKFSVYFFSGTNANLNQWSICDDFSEAQQVSSAYYAPGGSSTPHVLVGTKRSLHFLHEFIQQQNQSQAQRSGSDSFSQFGHNIHGPRDGHTANASGFHLAHTEGAKSAYGLGQTQEEHDFRIKHDARRHNLPRDDHDFAMKGISPLGEFEPRSESPAISQHSSVNVDTKYLTGLTSKGPDTLDQAAKKPDNECVDIFTDTPDFFNAVQTPGSHHTSSHAPVRDYDNLINSPSTGVNLFAIIGHNNNNDNSHGGDIKPDGNGHQSIAQEKSSLAYGAPLYTSTIEQQGHVYNDGATHHHDYDFGVQILGCDFQARDMLLPSPSRPKNASTSHVAHEDQFIDYSGSA